MEQRLVVFDKKSLSVFSTAVAEESAGKIFALRQQGPGQPGPEEGYKAELLRVFRTQLAPLDNFHLRKLAL